MAKAFSCRPSDYLPELDTWEAFCLDEAVAFSLAMEEKRIYDEAKGGKGEKVAEGKKNVPTPGDSAVNVMNHESFRKK